MTDMPSPEVMAQRIIDRASQEVAKEIVSRNASFSSYWSPQDGPQKTAVKGEADITFFGGTRGGGKSDCLIGRHVLGAEKWGKYWNGLIIRKQFKDFTEIRRRVDELISAGLPATRIGGEQQTNYIRFSSGAVVVLSAISHISMVDSFQGQQFCEISIDEAPSFSFIYQMLDKLKGSLRSPHGVPCHIFLTGNPGGPGSSIVKTMFMTNKQPGAIYTNDLGETCVFIPSKLSDNKILCENDPKYVGRLMAIKDKALREAWLNGNWDVFIGQAFDFNQDDHVIDPIWPIPDLAPVYMTFDWGFGKPFSVGWFWVDTENRLYRFGEWYGWDGETPDVGCRKVDSEIAKGIVEREEAFNLGNRHVVRLADPTCFNKKPDYRGGGQGPSTADEFQKQGILLQPGDPSRKLKVKQFRERLFVDKDPMHMPMMVVYNTCEHFIRTIPSLCVDERDPEDIDTLQEDHVYDEAAHVCMARPMSLALASPKPTTQGEKDWAIVTGQNHNQATNLSM